MFAAAAAAAAAAVAVVQTFRPLLPTATSLGAASLTPTTSSSAGADLACHTLMSAMRCCRHLQ